MTITELPRPLVGWITEGTEEIQMRRVTGHLR